MERSFRVRVPGLQLLAPAILVAILSGGCDRTGATRTALKDRDSQWSASLAALRSRQTETVARLAQVPSAPPSGGDARGWEAQRRRVEASVAGVATTLADVESRRKQSVAEVEASLAQGRAAGQAE